MPNLDAALETIRGRASTTVFQGRSFEKLVKAALLNHPGEFPGSVLGCVAVGGLSGSGRAGYWG